MNARLESRTAVLAAFGADSAVAGELLSYDSEGFGDARIAGDVAFPLADEPFVAVWRGYRDEAATAGFHALAERFVQLHFPIREGISRDEEYRAATRRGASPHGMRSASGLRLARPEDCTIAMHPTWAGAIPVVQTGCREDFVSLLRAFTARNEPSPVPASMGACIVSGYNNWDRVRRLQDRWTLEHPTELFSLGRVADLKDQYQDRFILLSSGWYSDVPPDVLGVTAPDWQRLSLTIRREHECAHYWTRRVLSSMRNRILDEIIADYCGIFAACARLRADWLLTFLGVDSHRTCRDGGRLHNYRGCPPLSDAAFAVLRQLVLAAVENLDTFDRRHAGELSGARGVLLILLTLCRMTLEDLAGRDAQTRLAEEFRRGRALATAAVRDEIRFPPPEARG